MTQDPAPGSEALLEALGQVLDAGSLGDRTAALGRFTGLVVGRTGRIAGKLARGGKPVVDLVVDLAGQLPARDEQDLRAEFPGSGPADIASALTRSAARTTAAVGAAGGGLAAVEWLALPSLAAVPAQIVAETVVVALVEIRLVAEIHAAYGVVPAGTASSRASAYLMSWARRRGIDPTQPTRLPAALGIAGRREVGNRLTRRFLRNTGTLAPMLIGAAIGANLNLRETNRLGHALATDLTCTFSQEPNA